MAARSARDPGFVARVAVGVPTDYGAINATWPLGWVRVTAQGISVGLNRSILFRMMLPLRADVTALTWSTDWTEVDSVLTTGKAFVVRKKGSRARVTYLRRADANHVLKVMKQAGVMVKPVRSLAWAALKGL
jgi:hypothetical protein